jgi:hypothetical protein
VTLPTYPLTSRFLLVNSTKSLIYPLNPCNILIIPTVWLDCKFFKLKNQDANPNQNSRVIAIKARVIPLMALMI